MTILTPSKLLTAVATLLLTSASAAPSFTTRVLEPASAAPSFTTRVLQARDSTTAAATDAWVTVDPSGTPSTVIPAVSVSDGTTTTVSAAPYHLTATAATKTEYAEVAGVAAAGPTATSKKGAGSFLECNNVDGEYAPFCEPSSNSSLYMGTTYYVTWDTEVFNVTNTTVVVEGSYVNTTTGNIISQAFSSKEIAANRSYYAWTIDDRILQGQGEVSISLLLMSLATYRNSTTRSSYTGPTVQVARTPTYHQPAPAAPSGAALYIGLPVVLGFCVLMIFGVCCWNRKARQIGIGNIMSRSRGQYNAAKDRARRRLSRRDKKQAFRLADNDSSEDVGNEKVEYQRYRDDDDDGDDHGGNIDSGNNGRRFHQSVRYDEDDGVFGRDSYINQQVAYQYRDNDDGIHVGVARRDSDALGSLAGTPTSEHFPHSQQYGRS